MFGVGVVPCVSQAESQRETETEEKGRWTERREQVTQEGRCETQGKDGEEREKKKGCEAHMFMLSVGKSEDEASNPKWTTAAPQPTLLS